MNKTHLYAVAINWLGNLGTGTSDYRSYDRTYEIEIDGKPPLQGSADTHFRGDPGLVNPEEMLVSALSSCHMLTYLALCAREGIEVVDYRDRALGIMQETPDGGGKFVEVSLAPEVTIAPGTDSRRAFELHEQAHNLCFIAQSVRFPVRAVPRVKQPSAD